MSEPMKLRQSSSILLFRFDDGGYWLVAVDYWLGFSPASTALENIASNFPHQSQTQFLQTHLP
jgi:hypothetical protein